MSEATAIPASSLKGADFFQGLRAQGYDFFTGVPCSILKSLYPILEGQTEAPYIEAVREDEAVAQAAGAFMGGAKAAVLMQNSGLGNCLNAIVSLNQIYDLPFLLIITWRGYLGKDAPEHIVMGKAMPEIFDSIGLHYQVFDPDQFKNQLNRIDEQMDKGQPSALIIHKGSIQ